MESLMNEFRNLDPFAQALVWVMLAIVVLVVLLKVLDAFFRRKRVHEIAPQSTGAITPVSSDEAGDDEESDEAATYDIRLYNEKNEEIDRWLAKQFEYIEEVQTGISLTRADNGKEVFVIPAGGERIIISEK